MTRKYEAADLGDKAVYTFYKEEGGSVDKDKYSKILREFYSLLFDEVIKNNLWFRMPHGFGEIRIQEKEVKQEIVDGKVVHNMRMDFNATKKLWANDPQAKADGKRIYHLNEHTDGYAYKIKWEKDEDRRSNLAWAYLFKPNRLFKNKLSAHLKSPERKTQYFR